MCVIFGIDLDLMYVENIVGFLNLGNRGDIWGGEESRGWVNF